MNSINDNDLKKTPIAKFVFILELVYSGFIGVSIAEKYCYFMYVSTWGMILIILSIFLTAFISFLLSIILHELGHLVFGLVSGYKFHSFQIFNIKLINTGNNKIKLQKANNMLLGQCVLKNDDDIKDMKYKLYLYGGSIFNLSFGFISLIVYILILVFTEEYSMVLLVFSWINFMLFYSNGVPLNVNNIYNDALNMKLMNKYDFMKYAVLNGLKLQREMEEKETINDVDDDLINSQNELDDYIIHKYPFIMAKTIKRIVNNEDNKFEFILDQHKKRYNLPIQYKYANITFVLYYYILNKISYKGILFEKTYKAIFKKPERIDSLLHVDFMMIDYLEKRKTYSETIENINNKLVEIEKEYTTKIERECYKVMFNDAINYVKEIEVLRNGEN